MIREVTFYPIRPTEKGLIGFASLVFDNKLCLNSIAVYTRPDGSDYRLLFPSRTLHNGCKVNTFFPIDNGIYEAIKEAIVQKIEEVAEKAKGGSENDRQSRIT